MDPSRPFEDLASGSLLSALPRIPSFYTVSLVSKSIRNDIPKTSKYTMGITFAFRRQISTVSALCGVTSLFSALMPSTVTKLWNLAMIPSSNSGGSTGGTSLNSSGSHSGSSSSSQTSSTGSSRNTEKLSLFSLFPTNPSLGLILFAPIVPAADNRSALALLTAVQFIFGMSLMTRRTPKFGESRFRHRTLSAFRFAGGSVAVFLAGFEVLRFTLPCDPWAEEARTWRKWAVKNGHNPSWWFGAISHYAPMPLSEWKVKTTMWVSNTINRLESEQEPGALDVAIKNGATTKRDTGLRDTEVLNSISLGPRAVLRAGESNTYYDIHEKLSYKNVQRTRDLLSGDLKDVTELNKAKRIDEVLENSGHVHMNEEYTKPNIHLGTHRMESDADFELVWANFDPWDELRQETDYDVRMIPRWRCVDESAGIE